MKRTNFTYEQHLELFANSSGLRMKEGARHIINRFQTHQSILARYAPVTYLLDYSRKNYLYVDEACFNLLGYTATHFIENGLESYKAQWHPDDYKILNEKVYPQNFNFIKTISLEHYSDYIFSCNHRVLNAQGEYIMVLQRSSFVAGANNEGPAGVIGVVFDISHFKIDLNIVHTIEKTTIQSDGVSMSLIDKKIYPVSMTINLSSMSRRELEILKLMSKGMNSKQIADEIKISINTVHNHRKNMLRKTNCKTSSELLNHAARHGQL